MTKFYETDKFKKVNAKWKEKLDKDGFSDIEQNEDTLKEWHSLRFKVQVEDTLVAAKIEYYRLAGHFLNEYKFKTALDHKIWSLHAEGLSYADISKQINKKPGKARTTIERLRTIMYNMYNNQEDNNEY